MIKKFLITASLAPTLLTGALHVTSHTYIRIENYAKERVISAYEDGVTKLAADLGLEKPRPQLDDLTRDKIIEREAKVNKVSVSLIKAVIKAESNDNQYAVSHAGAQGLMQVMPFHVSKCGYKHPSELFDEEKNIICGVRILKEALKNQKGNVILALKEYNGGAGGIDKTEENRRYPQAVLSKLE